MKAVIIGAGVAGLSIGWRLAQRGAEVVVLERARPGRGATWASAGMISVTSESGDETEPEARLAQASGALWSSFAAEIEERSGREVFYHADGAVIAAKDRAHATVLEARAKASGGRTRFMTGDEARAFEPLLGSDVAGALFDPDEARVDNRALGMALASALLRAGGKLATNEAVVRLEHAGGRATGALTPFTTHLADVFVLAAGAWTSQIEGIPADALPLVIPVKGEMIALAPPPEASLPKHVVWGNEVYLVPRHDRLLVGATLSRSGFDTSLNDEAVSWLLSRATAVMPALASWDMVERWAGLRPGSPDDLPILGATSLEGLYVASGQFRNGILFAPVIADALSRLILDRLPLPLIAPFSPERFRDNALLAKEKRVG